MKSISGIILAGALSLAAAAHSAPLKHSEAEQAVTLAAEQIERDYVDAAKAPALAARLRKEALAVRRTDKEGEPLARDITTLLQTLSDDPHFRLGYSADAMPPDIFEPKSGGDPDAAKRTARINNFGVLKAERLRGNVGLVDLDQFTDPALMQGPLAAAMELVRHCDALIVDLRYNGGGHARGAALAASYFLPEGPGQLLVRLETRDPHEALEIRTVGQLAGPRFLGKPVYVLTGPKSFSAAEMFAFALQQAGATIVGSKTRGGGNPVSRVRLTAHYALLLPTTRGVTPAGKGWEGVGIIPDLAAGEKEALTVAHRAALDALLAARPNDMLADNWRHLQAEMTPSTVPIAQPSGAAK